MKTDMIVIGAGPIGIELAVALKRSGVDYLHFDSGQIGSTIMRWPRNTVFFSSPEWIAISGIPIQTVGQEQITGEAYLTYLRQVVEVTGIRIRTYQRVEQIERTGDGFLVRTRTASGENRYEARRIAVAVGDMSKPNMLGIPGEELPHVTHFFQDPHQYFQKRLLIVGGRNSAMEAALRCWRAGVDVTVSYHRSELPKDHILSRIFLEIGILLEKGKIRLIPGSVPREIRSDSVLLERTATDGRDSTTEREEVPADFVLLATGYRPDQTLYEQIGVELEGASRVPKHDPRTMETNVPGVYLAGTTTGGKQSSHRVFITTSHSHTEKILRHAYGIDHVVTGNLPSRDYPLSPDDIE